MAEHPNVALVRRGYEAFMSGNLDALRELMSQDCVHHVPGRSQIAGDYKGLEAIFAMYGKLFELTGGTLRLEIHDMVGGDDHVVAMHTATGQRDAKVMHSDEVLVFHVHDGKVTEIWDHFADQYAVDDFFA